MAKTAESAEAVKKEQKVFDISDFFTIDAENEGIWFRPYLQDNPVPFEFRVLGKNSDRMSVEIDRFRKQLLELQGKPMTEERAEKERELYAETATRRIVGIQFDKGFDIQVEGKPAEYSEKVLKYIFMRAPSLASQVVQFSADTEGFYQKKNG